MIETLIVDDELNVGRVLQHMLKKNGYQCTIALNSAEARARLEEQSFDLVLLDIIMPGESGLDLLQYLQATYPDTAVVMISTIDDPEVAAKALELGAFGYLPKPFDDNEVLINLASAVRRRQLEVENRAQRQKLTELVEQRTAALIASETRHQTLVGALPDPVIAYDSEGRATYVNEAFEKVFGWSREEVIGHRIDFVPPEEKTRTREALDLLFRGEDGIFETRRLTRDGQVLDVHIRGSVSRDANGQVTESVVVIRDVTDRTRSEEVIRESEQRFRALFQNMSSGVAVYEAVPDEREFVFRDLNPSGLKSSRSKKEDILGRGIREAFPGVEDLGLLDVLRRVNRTGRPEQHPASLYQDNRLTQWVENYVFKLPSGEVVAVYDDVTQQKRAEQQSKQQFKFLETLINAAPSPIFYKDVEGRYQGCNQAFLEYLGRTRDQVVGKTVFELSPPELAEKYSSMDNALMQHPGTQVYETQVRYADGTRHDVIFNKATFQDPDGSVGGLIGIISDITERKQAEAQIQAERERFQTLTDQSPLGVSLIRPDGTYAYVNPAFTQIFGYTLDDVPDGRTWYRLAYPDPAERQAEIAGWKRDVLENTSGTVINKASTVRCKDGTDKVVHFRVVRLEAGDHLVLFEDITERTRAEKALRESEERYRDILRNIEEGYYEVDLKGNLTFFNDSLPRLYGYTNDELMGMNYRNYMDEDSAVKLFHTFNRVYTTGQPAKGSAWRIIRKDGTTGFAETSATLIKDAEGRGIGFRGIIRDITERRAAEEALRESEDRYRTLVEALPTGFIRANEKTEFLYFNDRLAEMLGYAPEELQGRRTLDFLDEANRQIVLDQVERRKKGATQPYELAWTKKDGQTISTMMYPNPIFDREGQYEGSFVLITDITDRKILESQLIQAQKLESVGQLAAGIAHEINTPTQYVTDNTRFLEEAFADLQTVLDKYAQVFGEVKGGARLADLESDLAAALEQADVDYLTEEIPRAVTQSLEGLGRISEIVRSMKAFAHPGPDTKAPLDLNQAILSTITVARNEWKYVADLETELDPELPPVPCVAGEINQVVLNIIVNAAQAIAEALDESSGEKGWILVSTRADGDWAEIRIDDTGPGIPPGIRDRVFDPFFTTKDPGKGTGQGLAIAYRVITDKHGGTIMLTSEENQGTTFVIRLPLTPDSPERDS